MSKDITVDIDYCPSAYLSFTGAKTMIAYGMKVDDDSYPTYCKDTLEYLNNLYKDDGIETSVMFNAQYQQADAKYLWKLRELGLENEIHSDSGGLQVMTQGLDLEKEKPGIYKTQGSYSDLAMSFDEMPVINTSDSEKSSIQSGAWSRVFIKDLAFEKGASSGRNIKEQIEEFIKQGSNTKVLVILQGYHIEDYNRYAEGVYSEIPEEYYDNIKGISLGNTSNIGYDDFIDVLMRLQRDLTFVPKQHLKHVHVLGASFGRVYPMFILSQMNYYDMDFKFSFDASTQCSAATWGNVTMLDENTVGSKVSLGGYKRSPTVDKFLMEMYKVTGDLLKKDFDDCNSFDEFVENYTIYNSRSARNKDHMESEEEHVKKYSFYCYNVFVYESYVLLKSINDLMYNKNKEKHFSNKWAKLSVGLIKGVKSYDDYMKNRDGLMKMFRKVGVAKIGYANTSSDVLEKDSFDDWI